MKRWFRNSLVSLVAAATLWPVNSLAEENRVLSEPVPQAAASSNSPDTPPDSKPENSSEIYVPIVLITGLGIGIPEANHQKELGARDTFGNLIDEVLPSHPNGNEFLNLFRFPLVRAGVSSPRLADQYSDVKKIHSPKYLSHSNGCSGLMVRAKRGEIAFLVQKENGKPISPEIHLLAPVAMNTIYFNRLKTAVLDMRPPGMPKGLPVKMEIHRNLWLDRNYECCQLPYKSSKGLKITWNNYYPLSGTDHISETNGITHRHFYDMPDAGGSWENGWKDITNGIGHSRQAHQKNRLKSLKRPISIQTAPRSR